MNAQKRIEAILLSTSLDYDPQLSNGLVQDQALALDMLADEIARIAWQAWAEQPAFGNLARQLAPLVRNEQLRFQQSATGFWLVTNSKGHQIACGRNLLSVCQFLIGRREPRAAAYISGIRLGHGRVYHYGETFNAEK